MADPGLPAKDVDPLPGPAFSYGKGEPIPAGMPSADVNTSPNNVFPSASDPGALFHGYAAATKQMGEINRQQGVETEKLLGEQAATSQKAVQLAEEAFKKSGYIPEELKHGWNAEEQTKKFTTDPIEAFGSLGSVLGILASSFTHAPLINSMDAAAAAMNAYKAADKENYDRAFKAWQENTKLFLDRHKLEREHMQDAVELLKTNMAAGEAKMRVLAARFNNQKLQVLFDNGMWKEGLEYIDAYNTAADKFAKAQKTAMDLGAERGMFLQFGGDPRDMSSPKSVEAYQKLEEWKAKVKRESSPYFGRTTAAGSEDAFVQQRKMEKEAAGGSWTSDDDLAARADWKKAHTAGLDIRERQLELKQRELDERERHSRVMEEIQSRGGDTRDALAKERERHDKEMERIQEKGKGAATNLTEKRQIASDVDKLVEKYKAEHPGATPEEVADYRAHQFKRLSIASVAPTGNRLDELRGKEDRVDNALALTSKIDDLLLRHKLITGLGGNLTRPPEIVANILGSSQTDREQFKRFVEEMRLMAPRILLDTQGRPISAEAERVNTIIAGLSPGDTGPNTIRAYIELREQLNRIKQQLHRRQGTGAAHEEAPAAKPAEKGWDAYPAVH